ncbi:MAG: PAS domain-containing protein [Anaerolineales bacterium]|nr:PAS domain-containing protein [Anaerolineales bacterium]
MSGPNLSGSAISRLLKPNPYQEYFRILSDILPDSILVISNDGCRFISVNHAFLVLSGYARSDLERVSPLSLFPGDSGSDLKRALFDCKSGAEITLTDLAMRTHPGSILRIDLEARPVPAAQNDILIIARASSIRTRNERLNTAQQEQFLLLKGMMDALFNTENPSLEDALQKTTALLAAAMTGIYRVAPQEPVYNLASALPASFPEVLQLNDMDTLEKPSSWSLGQRPDHPLKKAARASGLQSLHITPIGSENALIGLLVIGWEEPGAVSESSQNLMEAAATILHAGILLELQRQTFSTLQQRLSLLQTKLEDQSAIITDGILHLDSSYKVQYINPAAAKMLGSPVRDLQGRGVQDVLVSSTDILSWLLASHGQPLSAESNLVIHRRDGTPFPIRLSVHPRSGGEEPSLLVVFSDQSEKQAIADQNEALSQRALLGEVTAIFAHEVRNPINNISTGVQLIGSRLGEDHELFPSLDRIRKECTRLDQLLSDVLFFARPLELKMEPLLLQDLLDRLLQRWKPRLQQSNIECYTAFNTSAPAALADQRTLEHVLVNLITNAMQAMEEGGTLSVSLEKAITPQGEMVEIKIADTGPGIPQELIDRIFNPFFTTKKSGTGLGLAISRRILNAHKGHIAVESYPGAGTIFTIQIPAAPKSGQE